VVAKPPATAQYASIAAAMASILDASAAQPYVVAVGPGVYTEEGITVKPWVTVSGAATAAVVVQSTSNAVPVFCMSDDTALESMTLRATGGAAVVPLVIVADSTRVTFGALRLSSSTGGVNVGPASLVPTSVRILGLETDEAGMTDSVLSVDGSGASAVDVQLVTFAINVSGTGTAVRVAGANASLDLSGGTVRGAPGAATATGMAVSDGATATVDSVAFYDLAVGVQDAAGAASTVVLDGVDFFGVARTLQVANPLTAGHTESYLDILAISVEPLAPFFLANQDNFAFSVYKKGGDFTTLAAAIAHINALPTPPTAAQPYAVSVGTGTFVEAPFTIPRFVQITGVSIEATVVRPSSAGVDFVTAGIDTGLGAMTIVGPTAGSSSAIIFNGGPSNQVTATTGSFFMEDVQLQGAAYALIKVANPAASIASLSLRRLSLVGPFVVGLEVVNSGVLAGFLADDWNFNNSATLTGPCTVMRTAGIDTIQAVVRKCIFTDNTGGGWVTAMSFETGGSFTIQTTFTSRLGGSVVVLNSALAPAVRITACTFLNANPWSLRVLNAQTTGNANVVADLASISILAPSPMQLFSQSPTTGEAAISGVLAQGAGVADITNISSAIQQGGSLGVLSGGALSASGGLGVSVAAGAGYLMTVGGALKYVTWATLAATLGASTSSYLWVDSAGALQSGPAAPSNLTSILVGFARTTASTIAFFQQIASQAAHTTQLLDTSSRATLGPLYGSGSATSNGGGLTLNVTGGTYYYGTHAYSPSGASPVSILGYYGASSVVAAFTVLATPLQWDSAGVLTTLTGAQFAKHSLFVVNDGASERYMLVFAQQTYASQGAAEAGVLPIPPTFFAGNVAPIASVVVQGGGSQYLSIQDIRPRPGFVAASSSLPALDHQTLSNRGDVLAHAQYLLKDGTDTMTGALQMGGNAITNAGLINGVTIAAHAARHLPGGADPLLTAAPVTIGTANAEGVAASFSRSDHTHNHGAQTDPTLHAAASGSANGFMSAADKTILDGATATPTAGRLAKYDGSGQLSGLGVVVATSGAAPGQQKPLQLVSNNSNIAALQAPSALAASYVLAMPPDLGLAGTALTTDGLGGTAWGVPAYTYLKVVERLADLPAPVAGVITLAPGTAYVITTAVDLGANRLSLSGGPVAIVGTASAQSSLTSSAAGAMITSNDSVTLRFITLTSTVGPTLALNGAGSANPAPAVELVWVSFVGCATLGSIATYTTFTSTGTALTSSANLTFTGTIGSIAFFSGRTGNAAGTSFVFAAGLVLTTSLRILTSTFVAAPGNSSLNVSAAATIGSAQYTVGSCNFSGGGTYVVGVQPSDNKAVFTGNTGVANVVALASYFMTGNGTATTMGTSGVFVKVAGTTTNSALTQRFTHASNRATYGGASSAAFNVTAALGISGNNNVVFAVRVTVNGVTIAASESQVTTNGAGVRVDACACQYLLTLAPGDFVEMWIANNTNTTNPVVINMSVNIIGV